MFKNLNINSILSELRLQDFSVDISDSIFNIYQIFEKDKTTPGIIIFRERELAGLLSRRKFFEEMSKQFMYDLYSKRNVGFFITSVSIAGNLTLDSSTSVITAADMALQRSGSEIVEPLIVDFKNSVYRILDFYELLSARNAIQQLMNDLLKRANDFKQEVLAIVAHDLHNPIGAILGLSDLICTMTTEISQAKEFAGHINKTASHMEDLLNSFLKSATDNSVEFEPVFSWFDGYELLGSVIRNFDTAIKKKSQSIRFESESEHYEIYSDKIRLKEIFENLISNAIKYSVSGKEIYIRLHKNDGYLVFTVKDQGPGFSAKDLENIYGKFQRLSARPTADESSTGLGLFITKKIIDKLNGKIELESIQNIGSTFTVTVPAGRIQMSGGARWSDN